MTPPVRVVLPSGLGLFTDGRRQVDVVAGDVQAAIRALDQQMPGLAGHLVDRDGGLRPHLLCLVDGQVTRDLTHPVTSELRLLTAVSGG